MNLPYPASRARGELELLPLINIVFLLLIFFMLAGIVSVPGADRIDPPTSNAEDPVSGRNRQLSLAADGSLMLDGQPVALEMVGAAVAAAVRRAPDEAVVLRADARVDSRTSTR